MSRKEVPDVLVVLASANWRASARTDGRPYFVDELLMRWTGQPRKVCGRALERAQRRGLIEFGVSLRTAWPTERGRRVLSESTTAP